MNDPYYQLPLPLPPIVVRNRLKDDLPDEKEFRMRLLQRPDDRIECDFRTVSLGTFFTAATSARTHRAIERACSLRVGGCALSLVTIL
jgi:hypothetical protein